MKDMKRSSKKNQTDLSFPLYCIHAMKKLTQQYTDVSVVWQHFDLAAAAVVAVAAAVEAVAAVES